MSNTNFSPEDTQPNRVIRKESSTTTMNVCPKCLKDDQVQKVSAIVTSGTYTTVSQVPVQGEIAGHKIYGTAPQTGTGMTELAQRLSIDFSAKSVDEARKKVIEQDEKEFVKRYREKYPEPKDSQITTVLSVIGLMILAGVALLFFVSLFNPQNGFVPAFLFCCGVGVLIVLIPIAAKLNNPAKKVWTKNVREALVVRRKETSENYRQTIELARHKYSDLYYCHRDDIIFVPNETDWANSSEIMDFVSR